jgi:exodeoxyribonuclease-3
MMGPNACSRGWGERVKIATFKVNNINKRLPNLLAWLKLSKPDVVCLQELEAAKSEFPESPLRKAGYSEVAGQTPTTVARR